MINSWQIPLSVGAWVMYSLCYKHFTFYVCMFCGFIFQFYFTYRVFLGGVYPLGPGGHHVDVLGKIVSIHDKVLIYILP